MDNRRMKMVAELLKHLEELDAQELQEGMKPPVEEAGVVVAELDPDKTKQFEQGFKGALGGGGQPPPVPVGGGQKGPMEKLSGETAALEDDVSDEELDELEGLLA